VNDKFDVVDVDPSGRHVCSYQDLGFAAHKVAQGSSSLILAPSAVDNRGVDTVFRHLPANTIGTVTSPNKDDRRPRPLNGLSS